MIEFVTLFLGLLTGTHPVTVQVDAQVAGVEMLLDGELVGELAGAERSLEIDFGDALAPHLLEAVARDADGAELARASQAINLPRGAAEVSAVLTRRANGTPTAVALSWQSVLGSKPWQVHAWLDGEPLTVQDPAHISLPPIDSGSFHWFQTEIVFPNQAVARTEFGFGGEAGSVVATELTAVPVELSGRRLPDLADLQGRLRASGAELRVAAVERGRTEVVLVRGEGAAEAVAGMSGQINQGAGSSAVSSPTGTLTVDSASAGATASAGERMRAALALDEDSRLRLLLPTTKKTRPGALQMELFPTSPDITPDQGGLHWALTQRVTLAGAEGSQRLADAVAVAAVQASSRNHRRAVVLVLGPQIEDTSLYAVDTVRAYAGTLGVPLEVWWVGTQQPSDSGWGEARDVSDFPKLRRAVNDLEKRLQRQAIVWVEGRHLPQEIELAGSVKGVRLLR